LNYDDIQDSVNQFHTHFPEHKDETDLVRREQLRRYNDLVHAIETADRINKKTNENLHLLICPDSLDKKVSVDYDLEDYQYFDSKITFGELKIGYNHIGRHPLEIYYAKDVNVPTHQILCEHLIGPIHYLLFFNGKDHTVGFGEFYYSSGIQWPYALDDPRLAVGSVTVGQLKTVNGNILNNEEIFSIVKSCNKIVGWSIE